MFALSSDGKRKTKQMIPIITNSSDLDVYKGVHKSQMSGLRLDVEWDNPNGEVAACNKRVINLGLE